MPTTEKIDLTWMEPEDRRTSEGLQIAADWHEERGQSGAAKHLRFTASFIDYMVEPDHFELEDSVMCRWQGNSGPGWYKGYIVAEEPTDGVWECCKLRPQARGTNGYPIFRFAWFDIYLRWHNFYYSSVRGSQRVNSSRLACSGSGHIDTLGRRLHRKKKPIRGYAMSRNAQMARAICGSHAVAIKYNRHCLPERELFD